MLYLALKLALRNNKKQQRSIPSKFKEYFYLPQQFLISEFQNLSSKNLTFVKYEHNLRIHCTFMQANKINFVRKISTYMQANKLCKEYCYFTLSQ